jgi:MFS family permease
MEHSEHPFKSGEKNPGNAHVEQAVAGDTGAEMEAQDVKVKGEIFPGINMRTILAFLVSALPLLDIGGSVSCRSRQAICGQLNAYEMTLVIPAAAASYINAELGPNPDYIWINVTWGLGAAVLVSVSGRLSDIFGRRYFMLCGALISFVGTIVGATGQSIPQMIASGVLFGVGSGIQESGFACIMEFIPNKYRLTALGM